MADEEASEPRRQTGAGARAEQIVDAIIADVCDRSGLQNEWEAIDSGIQAEIRAAWMLIVRRAIEKA
jgi:hypothetical protein